MAKDVTLMAADLGALIADCSARKCRLPVTVDGEYAGELVSATAEAGGLSLKYRHRGSRYETHFGEDEVRRLSVTKRGLRGADDDGEEIRVAAAL